MASGLLSIGKERGRQLKETDKTPKSGLIAMGRQKNQGGLPGAVGYTLGRAGTDFLRVGEGVVDAALVPVDLLTGNVDRAKSRFMDSPVDAMRERLDAEYNPGKVAGFIGDIAGGIGQSVGYGLISAIPYAGKPMMYSSIIEQSISSAAEKTGEVGWKEVGYGATAGAVEGLLESKLGAGVNAAKGIGSAILKKTGINVAESAAKAGGKTMLKSVLTETAKGAAGEFAEEAISEAVDPALLRLYNIDENAQFSLKDVAYAGLIGGLSGGMMSAGPSAINYRSAVSVGRALQESRLDSELIKRARYTLSALEAAQTRSTGQIKGKPEGDTKETAKEWLTRTAENRKVKRLSKETAQLADKIRRNIQAYENSMKDPAMAQSEPVAALLGELRGNLFLVGYAYEADVIEQVMMEADDKQRQAFVDAINEELAAQGKKHDYTLADFDANKDDIRRGLAGRLMMDELQGDTAEYGAEAPQKPAQATTSPWDGMADNEDMSGYKAAGEAEEALLRAAVNWGVPRGSVQAMLDEYRKGTDLTPEEFAEGWSDGAHVYGRYGFNVDEESPLSRMSPEAREAAMKFGRETEEAERKAAEEKAKAKKKPAAQAGKKGTVVRGEGLNIQKLSDEQYAAYKAAEVLAEVLGTDIVIETKILTNKGKEANGFYKRGDNTIHININALRNGKNVALYTLGHEITHYIKEWSPTKFEALADFVLDQMGVDAETAIADKLASLKRLGIVKDTMTVAEANALAREELVAEGMELVLTDGKVLEELAHTDRSLWQKVKAWIQNIISKIRKYYGELNQASKTAQVLKETVESLKEIERLFTEGVREAGERTRTAGVDITISGDGDIIYAIGDETTKKASELSEADLLIMLENAQYGEFDDGTYIPLRRNTPEFYIEVVRDHSKGRVMVQNYPMAATVEHLRQNMEEVDGRSYGDKRPHELSPDEIVTISRKMGDPAYIVLQKNGRYAEVVSYYDSKKKKEVVVSIDIADSNSTPPKNFKHSSYMNGYNGGYYNIIVTQHELDDLQSYLDGTTVVYDKKKTNGTYQVGSGRVVTVTHDTPFVEDIVAQSDDSVNRKFSISENIPSTLSAEDQSLLFDADFYERYENESREPITETVEELETAKASEAFATMSDDEAFDLNAKLKAKRAGYNTVYDYYVETEKERVAEEYRRYLQTGRSNRTSRTLEEKRKKEQKERTLRSDAASATPLQNAQYKIIQETNPMWDEYHTGIRSPKEIKTFAEVAEDPDSFTWGDFTREDARKALRDGTVRVYSSYAIKNGVFVSTSYQQALEYAGNDPARVHSRVVALDSVAWINGDEGQYAKVYKDDGIRYSIDETPETPDVSDSPFDEALRRAGLSHLVEDTAETEDTETATPPRRAPQERDPEEVRLDRIRAHETLANALMEAAQNEHEFRLVKNYREKAAELAEAEVRKEDLRKKTAEVNREIDALQDKLKGVDKTKREPWVMTALTDAQKRKGELLDEMDALDEKLRTETDKLLSLASAKQLRKLIRAERSKAAAMEQKAEKAEQRAEKAEEKYRAEEKYKSDRREMSVRERVARRVVGRMNTMFYNPTKTKHVPADLQALVEAVLKSEKLNTFKETRKNLRQMAEMESEIEKLEQNPARTAKEQETLDKLHYKYAMFEDEGMDAKSQAVALYTAFKEWMERRPPALQDKALLEQMSADIDAMQDMPLSVMSMKSLEAVEDFYKEIYHQVNTANQAFATEKAANIDEMSTEANTQVKNAKELKVLSPRSREWAALAGVRSFLWKNMKPLTVFEAIGSDKLMEIFRRVLDAEDVWITDILEAKKVLDEAKKEFGYNKWNLKERREVTTADGSKVSLTLGEMMSLYAYNFREQAEEHLSVGGFVFAPDAKTIEKFKGTKALYQTHLNDQTTHRMRKADIAKMSEMLTEEQKAYAKAVQKYLTSLGEKGNKVSQKLYGIDLFTETAYFPIKSSHDYIETQTGKSGDPNIKSRGTFKETVPRAGNPIVLEDFMEVVGNHVNTMATYHAFVLPVEDLTRVWNYTPVNIKRDENGKAILDKNGMPVADTEGAAGYNSLKAEITKKYGKEANDYILQLLRDLNGGARRESAASILDKGLTAFKRSATMLSLSTIVQQPTSIIRAMAYVDAKHFTGASFVPWETVKKYAPVAAIKEMGGFDTGTGARTAEYINAKQYDSIKDAAKAAVTPEIYGGDPNVRAEAFGWLTGKADEVSWRYLFGAIINEQAEKLGKAKDSEAVLKAAGERFAEVVRHTQVYDSTLTRSEYMRSKDGLMKMATAFGAEPTTILSMAAEAIVKLERGDKAFFRKTAGAVAASILVNAVISSIIYAMRDDDEEKNILEKYTESVTSEIIEGFNPLEYLPIARDVMSIFKGYDIERTDMSLISNLYQQIELLTSSKRSPADKIAGVSGAVGAFFGLPITNVYRDAKGIVLTTAGILDPEPVTGRGMGNAVGQAIKGQTGLLGKIFGKERGDSYELYKAYVKGDKAHYNRVAARYETEADLEYALRRELRENDKRIYEAAEAKHSGDLAVYESLVDQIEAEGIFDRNIVIRAVNNEVSEIKRAAEKGELVPKDETATDEETTESLYTASDLNNALERGDTDDFAAIMAALVENKVSTGKTEAQAKASVKSSVTAYWKKQYLNGYQDTETRKRIIAILTETGLYGSRNDVATMCEGWVRTSK